MSESIRIVSSVSELRELVRDWKRAGLTVGLVPTMGALHQGHLALTRLAAEQADRVVTSIFVNPTQFGPNEDFERYPRRPQEDAAMLAANGCDLVFLPDVDTIYPPGHSVYVELDETADAPSIGMEGEFRPGHFRGVATVVAQLFNLVEPDLAVFGEKDAQQLAVVRRWCATSISTSRSSVIQRFENPTGWRCRRATPISQRSNAWRRPESSAPSNTPERGSNRESETPPPSAERFARVSAGASVRRQLRPGRRRRDVPPRRTHHRRGRLAGGSRCRGDEACGQCEGAERQTLRRQTSALQKQQRSRATGPDTDPAETDV